MLPTILDLAALRAFYDARKTPHDLIDVLVERSSAAREVDPAIFITAVDREGLHRQAESLLQRAPAPNSLPLWGIPFAVKDNIDVAELPTTAACPAFAFTPTVDAFVVEQLRAAGALVVGKTNLDQFATGLNGTRSPYGAPRCVFDTRYISGGSSSGSAVAVARGLVSFALGTDTAGSGRIPAACNNIVGLKPTPGRLSTSGVVPACRSIDVVTIFAGCMSDAAVVRRVAEGFDQSDPFSRVISPESGVAYPRRIGVLRADDRQFFGDAAAASLYAESIGRLETLGCATVEIDFAPFRAAAALLYEGPWIAERLAAIGEVLKRHRDDIDPTVRAIVEGGARFSAVDAFVGGYRLEDLRRQTETTWAVCDALLLPTAPTIYTVEAMRADPIVLNSNLGHYTNFANLLGLAAVAIPAGRRPDGLPFGITLVGPAWSDEVLAPLADRLHDASDCGMGLDVGRRPPPLDVPEKPDATIEIVVVGAHLSGMPLNHELTSRGGALRRTTRTIKSYRLFALAGTAPPKPGLIREPGFEGPGIVVEVWALSPEAFANFVAQIPSPLGIGRLALQDGTSPQGFLCERWALEDARDVTSFGGWAAYVKRQGAE